MQFCFEISRNENHRWDVNGVVAISQCCAIINNTIIEHVENDGIGEE